MKKSLKIMIRIYLFLMLTFAVSSTFAQIDTLIGIKLDSLIKLSNCQIKLLDPKKSDEYKFIQTEYNSSQKEVVNLKLDNEALLLDKTKFQERNVQFTKDLADSRLSVGQIRNIEKWSSDQGIKLSSNIDLTIQLSNKLYQIDNLFMKAPDDIVMRDLFDCNVYLSNNLVKINKNSEIYFECQAYIDLIDEYYRCLQDFELICQGISIKLDNSTIADLMLPYKKDLSKFNFLRSAYYFAAGYPDKMGDVKNFLWFLNNDVHIPGKK